MVYTASDNGLDITVLVVGATGMQGGGVARRLAHAGLNTVALTRNPAGAAAVALKSLRIRLVEGNLDDVDTLRQACDGVDAVFSVQNASFSTPDREVARSRNVIEAALSASVDQVVHSSVSSVGWRDRHPTVSTRGSDAYWDGKELAEQVVRESAVPHWTIVRPAFFMENFIAPKAEQMFPSLAVRSLTVASAESTGLALTAAKDLGEFVTAVVADPGRYHEAAVELAGDVLTFPKIAQIISEVTATSVTAENLTIEEYVERYRLKPLAHTHRWFDEVGYFARPEMMREIGIEGTRFRQWAEENQSALAAAVHAH